MQREILAAANELQHATKPPLGRNHGVFVGVIRASGVEQESSTRSRDWLGRKELLMNFWRDSQHVEMPGQTREVRKHELRADRVDERYASAAMMHNPSASR